MVNQYQDERSQSIYSIIDKSRTMRMPFDDMTLLDYAINSTLAFSNVALKKGDKVGLHAFSDRLGAFFKGRRFNRAIASYNGIIVPTANPVSWGRLWFIIPKYQK